MLLKRWKSQKNGEFADFFFNSVIVEFVLKSWNRITHFEKLKDCGVEKKNLLKILWKTRGKSNGKNFSKIRMLKLLKQKIGFSWKTGWERFPTPRKISEISGDFRLSTNCGKHCWKSSESLWKTAKAAWNRHIFFAEIGTFFEKKRALQTQSGCILWNMQPFFQNRKSEICLHKMEKWGKKKRQSVCL